MTATAPRYRMLLAVLGLLMTGLLGLVPRPASAAEAAEDASCVVTGYTAESVADLGALQQELRGQPVHRLGGTLLERDQVWVIPDGHQPVVVIDSLEPLPDGEVTVALAGWESSVAAAPLDAGRSRFVSSIAMPHLGPTARTVGLRVGSGPCAIEVVLSVDRSVLSTVAGRIGIAVAALFGVLLVVVARRRAGGWLRRFLLAAPLGLIAGAGEAVVLHEAGVIDPFGGAPWWAPAAGVALAALLPLTRRRRRPGAGPAVPADPPAGLAVPAVPALPGGYQVDGVFTVTEAAVVYRASRAAAEPPTPAPAGAGEAAARAEAAEAGAPDGATEVVAPGEETEAVAPGETEAVAPGEETEAVAPGQTEAAAAAPAVERVLLKVVRPEFAGTPAVRMRLDREAQVLSSLDHPNCVRLRETIAGDGPPVLAFGDVAGTSLRHLLDESTPVSGPQAVTILLGVLAGLAAVHDRGLVHRDVRPENIWLDADGQVVLAGFELACPGLEHAVAPEGRPPYASPEQGRAVVLDARSDLWSCGAVLKELLAPAGRPGQPGDPAAPPARLAELLAKACQEDPSGRPRSADQFAAELREAAQQEWGADWVGRGALAGALAAHGAIGSAATGYGVAGVVSGGAGAVSAGLGSAGSTGLGGAAQVGLGSTAATAAGGVAGLGLPASPAAIGVAGPGTAGAAWSGATTASTIGSGGVGSAAGSGAAAAGASAATAASSGGKAGAVITAAVAAAAVAAVGLAAVVVDPKPAAATSTVITPDMARVIFVRTVEEARGGDRRHLVEEVGDSFRTLLERDDSIRDGALTEVVVGVPRDQVDYPAWFVGSAQISFDDGTVYLFARFEREAAGEPWLMAIINWSIDQVLPAPRLDDDGWLAAQPAVADLIVDPQSLPERYADWLLRAEGAGAVGTDEILTVRRTGMLGVISTHHNFEGDVEEASFTYTVQTGEVRTDLVPLVDGTVHVVFTAIVHQVIYNRPGQRTASCDEPPFYSVFWTNGRPPGRFRLIEHDWVVSVEAWVPVRGAVADPPASPAPTPGPTPEPAGPGAPDRAVDPDRVVIEDTERRSTNRTGVPC